MFMVDLANLDEGTPKDSGPAMLVTGTKTQVEEITGGVMVRTMQKETNCKDVVSNLTAGWRNGTSWKSGSAVIIRLIR